jgi:DNA-binding beta-propeller fold protein YncE
VKQPTDVAVNQKGEILVAEEIGRYISIFSPTGDKLGSFGSRGSGPGQFSEPSGVTVDDDGNILVVDSRNYCIQKFTSDNKYITSVGSHDSDHLQFNLPTSVSISPITKKLAIADHLNCRVQLLNPDLTFHSSIGSKGSGNGQFNGPYGVAFDNAGNLYVTDAKNHRIQVKFENRGKGDGELDFPTGISNAALTATTQCMWSRVAAIVFQYSYVRENF